MKVDVAKHDQFLTAGSKNFQQFRKFRHELGVFQVCVFCLFVFEAKDSKRLIIVVHLGITRFKSLSAVLLA